MLGEFLLNVLKRSAIGLELARLVGNVGFTPDPAERPMGTAVQTKTASHPGNPPAKRQMPC